MTPQEKIIKRLNRTLEILLHSEDDEDGSLMKAVGLVTHAICLVANSSTGILLQPGEDVGISQYFEEFTSSNASSND